jgi:hypothetical protein
MMRQTDGAKTGQGGQPATGEAAAEQEGVEAGQAGGDGAERLGLDRRAVEATQQLAHGP